MDTWIEAQVVYDGENKSLAAEMISNIFYDIGLQGILVEDPEYEAVEGWADETIQMPKRFAVTGYIPEDDTAEDKCNLLEKRMMQLAEKENIRSEIFYRKIKQEDWGETWKAFFEPQQITSRITVKPSWRQYRSRPDEIVIEIDPGMAFGTGTHATTQLCISMIEKYLKKGDTFLDVGTGSGILLIAAAKLGARKALGIDIDHEAINRSKANLKLNNIVSPLFEIQPGSLVESVKDRYDMVAANILPGAVLTLLDDVHQALSSPGIFICSGFLESHVEQVTKKLAASGYEILDKKIQKSWVAIASGFKR